MTTRIAMVVALWALGQIPPATDAPKPLSPAESAKTVTLPEGYRLELLAAEPLVREAAGVCWDERGRLFVCELHGYNLEGQYDIDELNKTGKLDTQVRRIHASAAAQKLAQAGTYGTVKLLVDSDGDGKYDKATVYADKLPPCYGIVPARGGVIVACAPDIMYLADSKNDGVADVREVLFTGFRRGPLERGVNCPQWGTDNWIYFGSGHGGGTIRGPKLKNAVQLPGSDFRIKADGSAIEPVSGATHTIGFAETDLGERFVATTNTPGMYVPPLPWHYLARNPAIAVPGLEQNVLADERVYPTSAQHPWRTKRGQDPGYVKFYGSRETKGGAFTSACSPMIYRDRVLPGLHGHFLACEPAQNLVHRAMLERKGLVPRLQRLAGEENKEFLAAHDIWFHPMALTHAPDGTIAVVDFYREIIEDYSAVPRHLQQIYGVVNGKDHGRVWKISHRNVPAAPAFDMSELSLARLAQETASPYFWRRQTARRLLLERSAKEVVPHLTRLAEKGQDADGLVNVLYTLDGLGQLQADTVLKTLDHDSAAVRLHALRLAEKHFAMNAKLLDRAIALTADPHPAVVLQAALSLGESDDPRVLPALAELARNKGDERWLPTAILSSLSGKGAAMLRALLEAPAKLDKARAILGPLCAGIGAVRDGKEIGEALVSIEKNNDSGLRVTCLRGVLTNLKSPTKLALDESGRKALAQLAGSPDAEVRAAAGALTVAIRIEDPEQRRRRLALAVKDLNNVQLGVEARLAAVAQLAGEDDVASTSALLKAFASNTAKVREAILDAVFSRRERLPQLVDALEKKVVPAAALSGVQRVALLQSKDVTLRQRAAKLLEARVGASDETFKRFAAALSQPRDLARGEKVFRERCATCHQAHGVGLAVGPDLTAEFQRAEETILTDILAPSAIITPGFATYAVETSSGQVLSGILRAESANSLILRGAEAKEQVVLRKDIERLYGLPVSLMPEDLVKVMSPQDVADVIAFIRNPPERLVLFDDDAGFVRLLDAGEGTAEFVTADSFLGKGALRVTPPQRFSPRIKGWSFRFREKPDAGEYRYLRFAWKSAGATGIMIELANDGKWPAEKSSAFRYFAGKNTTSWSATRVSDQLPGDWVLVTRDLWKDFGDCTITGIAPTPMGGAALFDGIELRLRP